MSLWLLLTPPLLFCGCFGRTLNLGVMTQGTNDVIIKDFIKQTKEATNEQTQNNVTLNVTLNWEDCNDVKTHSNVDAIIDAACSCSWTTCAWPHPILTLCPGDVIPRPPGLVRITPDVPALAQALGAVWTAMDWHSVVVISQRGYAGVTSQPAVQDKLLEDNVPEYFIHLNYENTTRDVETVLSRVIDTHKVMLIDAQPKEALQILTIGRSMGMFTGHQIVTTVGMATDFITMETDVLHTFQGLLDISASIPQNNDPAESQSENLPLLLLDNTIKLYEIAAHDVTSEGGDPRNATLFVEHLKNTVLSVPDLENGITFDKQGDVICDVSLRNIQNGSFAVVAEYFIRNLSLVRGPIPIMFPGGGSGPIRVPRNNDYRILAVAVVCSVLLLVGIVILTMLLVRRQKKQNMLSSMQWKIRYEDLQLDVRSRSKQFGSRISKGLSDSSSHVNPKGSMSLSMADDTMSLAGNQQIFTKVGFYLGTLVAVKRLNKNYVYVTKEMLHELNEVRNLTHTNLNGFLGATVEPYHICVVSAYCNKGSLQDVLENDNIKLDRIFKISFASDIAHGMCFLHDSIVEFHGNLKSSNILLDNHWTCKISNFGLRKFREGERLESHEDYAYYYHLLWTAPEHLREDESARVGSKKGDVYSFAIILQEILTRCPPFLEQSEDPENVIQRVIKREHPVFRPKIPSDVNEENLLDLMRICWEEIQAFRPNFITIRDSLKKLNNGRQANLVDQMMHMMEKYADHLEELVDERTQQLAEEQARTEELLCRMLPKPVAEELKAGRNVAPQTFNAATIFFSDVVGFTAMAAASTPLQVVDFLNDLYTCFDTIIESYDVYKVETIGDAYMVVSGLPVINGHRHAGEICTMALDLLSAIRTFTIRHIPDKQLQLRCGIHTGPVVAGVVGLKMPRYCLFGDTVNYASRMESSGLALHIHVSPECKVVLDDLSGYKLKSRGLVEMKGKGAINTYFLTGKEGFDKDLPDLILAAKPEDHEFK